MELHEKDRPPTGGGLGKTLASVVEFVDFMTRDLPQSRET
jgi:hypothetical protein